MEVEDDHIEERVWLDPAQFAKKLRRQQTPAERVLADRLKSHKLDGLKWRPQQTIGTYTVDFYCPEVRVCVEIDGESHERRDMEDEARDRALVERGQIVLRFTNDDVLERTDEVVAEIRRVCAGRKSHRY